MSDDDERDFHVGIVFCIGVLLGISAFLYWATFEYEELRRSPETEQVREDHG